MFSEEELQELYEEELEQNIQRLERRNAGECEGCGGQPSPGEPTEEEPYLLCYSCYVKAFCL